MKKSNIILGVLLIVAGFSMMYNGVFTAGIYSLKLEGINRYILTIPEILVGIYLLYFELYHKINP